MSCIKIIFKDITFTEWSNISDICLLWNVQGKTYLSRCNLLVKYTYLSISLSWSHSPFMWEIVGSKRCEWKMKSCDFYEELWFKWKVATFTKSCDLYEKLRLEWKIVTLMKNCEFYERWWPFRKIVTFQMFVTFPVRHNKNFFTLPLFSINWGIYSHFKT